MNKLVGVHLDDDHIKFMDDNYMNHSEFVRFLFNSNQKYIDWRKENGK